MHGNFYPQHYMQHSAQGNQSSNLQRNADLTQPGQIRFTPQHGLTNGQSLQGPGVQHLQQHRLHPTPHPGEFTQQHYSQFLQNQVFYNQLQQQQQSPSVRQQQEQHQRLLHQQLTPNDQTLRSLLSINHQLHLQQQATPHHIAATQSELLQMQAAKAGTRFAEDRSRTDQLERSRNVQNHRNISQNQNVLSPEMMRPRQHKPSSGPSPPHYHPQNTNYLQNMVLPSNRSDLMSGLYSPARGHLAPTRPQTSSRPDLSQEHQAGYPLARTRSTSHELTSPRRITPTGVPAAAPAIHVKRQTPSVNSTTEPVIIYDSDDDDVPVMPQSKAAVPQRSSGDLKSDPVSSFSREVIDSDIEIVGYKEAEIMSHVRPDCPIHPFQRRDSVVNPPLGQNGSRCSKCFCYVCDKLASSCEQWTESNMPHCNAHARASCWKARRSVKKSPVIERLPNDRVTKEITDSGEIGLQFMIAIRERYITYRNGTPCEYNLVPCECPCHRNTHDDPCTHCKVVHDAKKKFNYQPVRETTLSILQEIKQKYVQDRPITALIALDAVLSELCSQRPADFNPGLRAHSNPDVRCQCNFPVLIEEHLEPTFIAILTRFEVPPFFLDAIRKSVSESVKPLQLEKIMKKFKAMRHWDDLLLRAVMSGSNATGSIKGRDHLQETPQIVRHRIEKLDRENKFLQMLRYLRTVKLASRDDSILKEMERWKLLCSSHRGRFKEVVVHLMDLLPRKNVQLGDIHRDFPMGFTLRILNALTQVGADVQFESFESRTTQIGGLDADAAVFLVLLILNQKQLPPTEGVALILWLVKWVNRNMLSPSLDPSNTRLWFEQGSRLIALAHDSMAQGNATRLLESLQPRDPRVHLLVASICVVDFAARNPQYLESHHRTELVELYRNNDWALFLLLTQSRVMSYHDSNFLRWLTKFCDSNPGIIAQIQDSVISDAVKFCPLDVVSDFLSSLIKPTWVCSIEPIKKTVVRVLSEFSDRLFHELPRADKSFLAPKSRWIEDILLIPFLDRKLTLLADSAPFFKNVVKTGCFLNASKRIVELSRSVAPDEWPRHCDKLVRFLMEKFKKSEAQTDSTGSDCFSAEEFSLLLSLLWSSRRREEFKFLFAHFQENHSCADDGAKAASWKMPNEIAVLLDSADCSEYREMKVSLLEDSRRLCLVETLSWLTCTSCASRMSSHWCNVWISVSKFPSHLRQLTTETLSQFKDWLNRISLDAPDSYARLLSCLKTFLGTLVGTWQRCAIPLVEVKRLLIDVAAAVKDLNFQRDLTEMATSIVDDEMKKQKVAPAPTMPQHRPVNDETKFELTQNHRTVTHNPRPKSPAPPQRPTNMGTADVQKSQQNGSTPSTNSGNQQSAGVSKNTSKASPEEEGPFSPLNLSRTKPCPNCGVTISCALFRCPHCNKPTKSKQPVLCPGCHQENVQVKKYSCEFCYRSLIDVMFAGNDPKNEEKNAEKNVEAKSAEKKLEAKNAEKKLAPKNAQVKIKAKGAEMKNKAKNEAKNAELKSKAKNAEIKTQEPKKKTAEKRRKKSKSSEEPARATILPKTLRRVSESSDSDDFQPEPPKKIPKLKTNFAKPPPSRVKSLGGSLTDSDSDSVCSEPQLKEAPPQKIQFDRTKTAETHKTAKNNSELFHHNSRPSIGAAQPNHKLQAPKEIVTHAPRTQPKMQPAPQASAPKKRGVGHSSAMSKNQKKLLRKFKNPKFPITNTGNKSKDLTPTSTKSKSFENPPSSNHLHNPEKPAREQQSSSGLSFGLAKVRARNVGHRTGGRPGQQKSDAAKEFLFPQPLNDREVSEKSRKRERFKKMLADNPQMGYKYRLEKKLASLVAKRKPGPARMNNYRKIAKIERRLRRLRKPHKSWKIPQNMSYSPEIDLSMHVAVSLSPFPKDKLKRIQSLVPQYRLATLFA